MGTLFGIAVLRGSTIALIAVGFALIFRVAGFLNFAHGAIYTCGAYFAYTIFHLWNLPLTLAVILSIAVGSLLGLATEVCIYGPLRRQGAGESTQLLASLGIIVVLQNFVSLIFGDIPKTLRFTKSQEAMSLLFGIRLTSIQIGIIVLSVFVVCAVAALLHYSSWGRSLRAVASDSELALVVGLKINTIIYQAFIIGSCLAVLSAILISFDLDMTPGMGLKGLILGIVAMVLGGKNSIMGILIGAFILGFAQSLATWYFGIEWQDTIAFIILIIFLLFKPEGFFGKKSEKAFV